MSSAASPGAGLLTLVVADRHPLLADGLARALRQRRGLRVAEIHPSSGAEAVEAVLRVQPDMALLDLWLEGVTAVAATHSLAGAAPQVHVIVLGWRHEPHHIAQAMAVGAAGFLAKEVGIDDLVAAIHHVAVGQHVVIESAVGNVAEPGSLTQMSRPARQLAACEPLTVRELEVLGLLGDGLLVEDIAARLDVTRKTAQTHIGRILDKTGTRSQLQAVAAAREEGHLA